MPRLLQPVHARVNGLLDSDRPCLRTEVSRMKMSQKPGHVKPIDYAKLNALYDQFVPQKELSREQAYWLSATDIASLTSDPPKPVTPFVHTSPAKSQVQDQLAFDKNALETEISQLKDNISSLRIQNDGYKIEIAKQNRRYLELSKASTHSRNTSTEKLVALHDEIAKMKPSGCDTKVRMKPVAGVSKTQSKSNNQKSRVLPSKNVARPKMTPKYIRKTDITVAPRIVPQWKPTGRQFLLCDIYGPKKSLTPIAKPLELSPSVYFLVPLLLSSLGFTYCQLSDRKLVSKEF
ncbi:hypothetical protein Tco_1037040 [Tanacetum coccineum]